MGGAFFFPSLGVRPPRLTTSHVAVVGRSRHARPVPITFSREGGRPNSSRGTHGERKLPGLRGEAAVMARGGALDDLPAEWRYSTQVRRVVGPRIPR